MFQQTFPNPVKMGANVLTPLHLVWTAFLLRYYWQVFGECHMLGMHLSFCLTFRCSLHYLQCDSLYERTLPTLWCGCGPTFLIKCHQPDWLSLLISIKRKPSLVLQTKIRESSDLSFMNICFTLSSGKTQVQYENRGIFQDLFFPKGLWQN